MSDFVSNHFLEANRGRRQLEPKTQRPPGRPLGVPRSPCSPLVSPKVTQLTHSGPGSKPRPQVEANPNSLGGIGGGGGGGVGGCKSTVASV